MSTESAHAALDALPLAVLVVDRGGEVHAANPAAAAMLPAGGTLGEVLKCRDDRGRALDWPAELAEAVGRDSPPCLGRLHLDAAGGTERLVEVHPRRLAGEPERFLLLIEDVTGRVAMERRLAAGQRLASVGKLAATVAHELNNPLDGMLRYLGLAGRALDEGHPDEVRRHLGQLRSGAERMARIVADLLDMSRSAGRPADQAPLRAVIDEAVEAMAPAVAAAGVTVVCDLDAGASCKVPAELFQVICNLMRNAADAVAPSGRVVISCRRRLERLTLSVSDTGRGIAPELLEQVFEPFFSTRPGGRGTGLGLSICRGIVERFGGSIRADNGPAGGAVLTVTLPADAAATGGAQ